MNSSRPARPRLGLAAVCLLGATATGCTVGPNYQHPDLGLTAGFHTPAPATTGSAPLVDAVSWWAGFGDPQLARVVERAASQNLDLAKAKARLAQSRALSKAAEAALRPSLSAAGSTADVSQSLDSPIGEIGRHLPGFQRDFDDQTLGVSATWEIDLFGGLRRARQAAAADARSAKAEVAAVKVAVEADAADAYFQIRAYQQRLVVARRQEGVQADLVVLLRRLNGEGVSPERELHEAEAELERVRASVPPLETGLEAELNRLEVLMAVQPGTGRQELLADRPLPLPPGLASSATPADLLRRRPDIIAAEERLTAANARIGSAIAEYYPNVSLQGLLGVDSVQSGQLFAPDALQHQIAAGLRWRLFDFGRIDADVAKARGEEAEALADYRSTVLTAVEDVENAFTDMTQQQARAAALERQIAALAQARVEAEKAYEGGVISLAEVRNADRDVLTASDALVQARAGADRAAAASFRALGGDWSGMGSRSNAVRLSSGEPGPAGAP